MTILAPPLRAACASLARHGRVLQLGDQRRPPELVRAHPGAGARLVVLAEALALDHRGQAGGHAVGEVVEAEAAQAERHEPGAVHPRRAAPVTVAQAEGL